MSPKDSSIVVKTTELIETSQTFAPTLLVVAVLIVSLYVLKKFIYISDEKRDDA